MMNRLLITIFLFVGFSGAIVNANPINGQITDHRMVVRDTTVKYTCPYHPEVIGSKPGKCPKCGTQLVVRKNKDRMARSDMKKTKMKKDSILHETKATKRDKTKMKKDTGMIK